MVKNSVSLDFLFIYFVSLIKIFTYNMAKTADFLALAEITSN